MQEVKIIGAGLAGSEAALQLSKKGIKVKLYEMRPNKTTGAHVTENCAEFVCSNSLGSADISNASGLLKKEMETTLKPIDQLGYLFLHNRAHEKSKNAEIVEEAKKIHDDFLKDEKEFIHACEIERERMVIRSMLEESEEKGLSQGIVIEKLSNAQNMIEAFYGKHNLTWLEELENEKLDQICTMISQGFTYEQLKDELMNQ